MAHWMFIRVKITEKASGRIITYIDPDDEYYPFETDGGLISSAGYAEVCCVADEDAIRRAGVVSQSRDAVLTAEQLRGIYELSDGKNAVLGAFARLAEGIPAVIPAEWLDDEVPDPDDRDMLVRHPELYSFDFVLENNDP